ncbi:flagellar export protein FliJ [Robbsia sp. Bb-Pol-6]|uniref:Flagellar FliJ protein n=1 Tax=Robbsia betulipollinis TaxID=2981849 RepID=A0ABT3ZHH0_9BURK|nr:flagellar export protein FliJ [Robbsia betulipollinis]MCY0385979.1 flagellar export protein FliJ [Robbsia betulipollinis]
MSKRLPYTTLIELAQKDVDEASRALGALQRRRDDMLGKRQDLDGYRGEYENRLAAASREGMTMLERRNFDAFLGTLGTAIHQQQAQVVALDQALEGARRQWQVKKQKLSSYEALEKRAVDAQRQREAKSEQRASDEFAARRARDRAAA